MNTKQKLFCVVPPQDTSDTIAGHSILIFKNFSKHNILNMTDQNP